MRYSVVILFVVLRLEYGIGNNGLKSRFSDAKLVSVMSLFSPRKEKEKTFLSKVFFLGTAFERTEMSAGVTHQGSAINCRQ